MTGWDRPPKPSQAHQGFTHWVCGSSCFVLLQCLLFRAKFFIYKCRNWIFTTYFLETGCTMLCSVFKLYRLPERFHHEVQTFFFLIWMNICSTVLFLFTSGRGPAVWSCSGPGMWLELKAWDMWMRKGVPWCRLRASLSPPLGLTMDGGLA